MPISTLFYLKKKHYFALIWYIFLLQFYLFHLFIWNGAEEKRRWNAWNIIYFVHGNLFKISKSKKMMRPWTSHPLKQPKAVAFKITPIYLLVRTVSHFSSIQMALNLSTCSSSCHPKHPPLSRTPSYSLPKTSFSSSLSPTLFPSFQNSSFSALAIQSHKPKLEKPTFSNIKSTRPTVRNNKQISCALPDSNYGGNRAPRETILLPGCDYEHWLIVMEFPKNPKPTPEEMIDTYIKTLAQVVGRYSILNHF